MSLRLQNEGQKKLTDSTDAHGVFDTDFFDLWFFDLYFDFRLILIVPCRTTGMSDGFCGKKTANIIF